MRAAGAAVLLYLSAVPATALAQGPPCPVQSTYDTAHTENLAALRRSLYLLSKLPKSRYLVDRDTKLGLADGAVFCLANIYSLGARVRQGCKDMTLEQFNEELATNTRFITLLSAGTGSPPLWVGNEQEPLSFVAPALAVANRKLDFDPEIKERLRDWSKPAAVRVASSQLLYGQGEIKWDEEHLTPLERTYQINPQPQLKELSSAPLGKSLTLLKTSDNANGLKTLARYYLSLER